MTTDFCARDVLSRVWPTLATLPHFFLRDHFNLDLTEPICYQIPPPFSNPLAKTHEPVISRLVTLLPKSLGPVSSFND